MSDSTTDDLTEPLRGIYKVTCSHCGHMTVVGGLAHRDMVRAADRIDQLTGDKMATRLQEMGKRVGCPLGLDIIDWVEKHIKELDAELVRIKQFSSNYVADNPRINPDLCDHEWSPAEGDPTDGGFTICLVCDESGG